MLVLSSEISLTFFFSICIHERKFSPVIIIMTTTTTSLKTGLPPGGGLDPGTTVWGREQSCGEQASCLHAAAASASSAGPTTRHSCPAWKACACTHTHSHTHRESHTQRVTHTRTHSHTHSHTHTHTHVQCQH